MSVAEQVKRAFPQRVRSRGFGYLANVRIEEGGDHHVVASVRGQSRAKYQVTAIHDNGELRVSCDCPYFESSGPCKHLWAVLIMAERHGYLTCLRTSRNLKVKIAAVDTEDAETAEEFVDDIDEIIDAQQHVTRAWSPVPRRLEPRPPPWRQALSTVVRGAEPHEPERSSNWFDESGELVYVIDPARTLESGNIFIETSVRRRKRDGTWSRLHAQGVSGKDIPLFPDPTDRRIVSVLVEPRTEYEGYGASLTRFALRPALAAELLPAMCSTGRCFLRIDAVGTSQPVELVPLAWDAGQAWQLRLRIAREKDSFVVAGDLVRSDEHVPLSEPVVLTASGFVIGRGVVARLECGAFQWIVVLRAARELRVPLSGQEDLLRALYGTPTRPLLDVPEELRVEEARLEPKPHLKIRKPQGHWRQDCLWSDLRFDYGGTQLSPFQPDAIVLRLDERRVIIRDQAFERDAIQLLSQLGFRSQKYFTKEEPVFQQRRSDGDPFAAVR